MLRRLSTTRLAELALLYTTIVWGSTFFLIKDILHDIHPILLLCYRFLAAALIMGVALLIIKKPLWQQLRYGILVGVLLWLTVVPQTIGLEYTTASNSGFITGLFVIFVPLLAMILHRRWLPANQWLAVALSVLGLWLLTGGLAKVNVGDGLTLLASIACAMHIIAVERAVKRMDPYVLSFQQLALVGALSLITAVLFDLPFGFKESKTLWVMVFLTIFPTISAFVIQLVAQKHITAVRVAMLFTIEPVFAAIFAWTFGGEPFIWYKACGGLVIVAAMMAAELPLDKWLKRAKKLHRITS